MFNLEWHCAYTLHVTKVTRIISRLCIGSILDVLLTKPLPMDFADRHYAKGEISTLVVYHRWKRWIQPMWQPATIWDWLNPSLWWYFHSNDMSSIEYDVSNQWIILGMCQYRYMSNRWSHQLTIDVCAIRFNIWQDKCWYWEDYLSVLWISSHILYHERIAIVF